MLKELLLKGNQWTEELTRKAELSENSKTEKKNNS